MDRGPFAKGTDSNQERIVSDEAGLFVKRGKREVGVRRRAVLVRADLRDAGGCCSAAFDAGVSWWGGTGDIVGKCSPACAPSRTPTLCHAGQSVGPFDALLNLSYSDLLAARQRVETRGGKGAARGEPCAALVPHTLAPAGGTGHRRSLPTTHTTGPHASTPPQQGRTRLQRQQMASLARVPEQISP